MLQSLFQVTNNSTWRTVRGTRKTRLTSTATSLYIQAVVDKWYSYPINLMVDRTSGQATYCDIVIHGHFIFGQAPKFQKWHGCPGRNRKLYYFCNSPACLLKNKEAIYILSARKGLLQRSITTFAAFGGRFQIRETLLVSQAGIRLKTHSRGYYNVFSWLQCVDFRVHFSNLYTLVDVQMKLETDEVIKVID